MYTTTRPVWQKREICGYLMGFALNRDPFKRGAQGASLPGAAK
jgi:hypothetical protein